MNRKPEKGEDVSVSYEDYFGAVQSFMEKRGLKMIGGVVSEYGENPIGIQEIRIFLDKHGEFYHPARIEAVMEGKAVSFVLNVAVSTAGKKCLEREFCLLKKLRENYTYSFVPEVYGRGDVFTKSGHHISMFLGEWFEGFHEFHLSLHPRQRQNTILVWEPQQVNFWLSRGQTRALYRQAAMILTYYYDVETFEQIFNWHHAAGDFVVKLQSLSVKVRLVTVRKYVAMVDNASRDIQSICEALLVFFLNLTIRMRLDRLDGIGEVVWADDMAVEGALQGFFDGLSMKPSLSLLPASLDECFRYYLLARNETELHEYATAIVDSNHPKSPDVPILQKHLKEHIAVLYHSIQNNL